MGPLLVFGEPSAADLVRAFAGPRGSIYASAARSIHVICVDNLDWAAVVSILVRATELRELSIVAFADTDQELIILLVGASTRLAELRTFYLGLIPKTEIACKALGSLLGTWPKLESLNVEAHGRNTEAQNAFWDGIAEIPLSRELKMVSISHGPSRRLAEALCSTKITSLVIECDRADTLHYITGSLPSTIRKLRVSQRNQFPNFSENAFRNVVGLRSLDIFMIDDSGVSALRGLGHFVRRNKELDHLRLDCFDWIHREGFEAFQARLVCSNLGTLDIRLLHTGALAGLLGSQGSLIFPVLRNLRVDFHIQTPDLEDLAAIASLGSLTKLTLAGSQLDADLFESIASMLEGMQKLTRVAVDTRPKAPLGWKDRVLALTKGRCVVEVRDGIVG